MTLDLIQIRRSLHQIPEIGLEEFETQAYLLDQIETLVKDKPFTQYRTWRTGILVFIKGTAPEKTIVKSLISVMYVNLSLEMINAISVSNTNSKNPAKP